MATAEIFARRMRAIAKGIEENSSVAVIKTAALINQTVVLATPVDTGRARGGWQIGIGFSPRGFNTPMDPNGSGTVSANRLKIGRRRSGQTIHIANNVEYIGFLNDGSSAQAPAGFVELAVRQAAAFVKRARVVKL